MRNALSAAALSLAVLFGVRQADPSLIEWCGRHQSYYCRCTY